MQNAIENEKECSNSTLEYTLEGFDHSDGNTVGEYKNIVYFEKGQYIEPVVNKSVFDKSLYIKNVFPDYFFISLFGMFIVFIYEIMALFRIFTLFDIENVPSMSLFNRVKSFELFFSAASFLYIFFIMLMHLGLYKSINNKWIKMCIQAGADYENFQDSQQSKRFGDRFVMALEYAIDQFESDFEDLSECSKYVWNKNKFTLYKIRAQSIVLPVFSSTIAHLVLSAYIYYITKFHNKMPLGHPVLITEFRWFALIQYKGLAWVLLQFSISLLVAFLVFKNNKNMKNVIEKRFESSLINANCFGYDLINKVWGSENVMPCTSLKNTFCSICIDDGEVL